MGIGSASGPRSDGRAPDQMRALSADLGVQKWAEGSAIITVGNTVVICSASVEDRVPPHLRGKGTGWITAEYSMLPRATNTRSNCTKFLMGNGWRAPCCRRMSSPTAWNASKIASPSTGPMFETLQLTANDAKLWVH